MLALCRSRRIFVQGAAVVSKRVCYALCLIVASLGGVVPGATQTLGTLDSHGIPEPSIATSLPQYGDPSGARKSLSERGFTYYLIYTNDVLSNLSGGNRRGTIDQGKLEAQFTLDLGKFAGWKDLTLYANAFQINNTGRIRRDYVGGLNTIAAIEANPATRLSELWLERKFLDGAASFKIGQLAADSEFFFSDLSNMFLQTDWPTIAAFNLPGGGPAYPLSTPGARVKFDVSPDVSLLAAVFNGDPAGPCAGDPDTCNRYGLNFRVRDPAFAIAEAQFRSNQGKQDTGLARTVKLGGWSHFGLFGNQRIAIDGTLLADPAGSGIPAQHRGDYGFYGIIDQQIYRPRGGGPESGVSVFGLASISPSDRNLISVQLNGGVVFAGLIPGRPDDRFGASMVYSRFSDGVRAFDQDLINITGVPGNVRDYEANIELSYVAQIVPGWTVQPDFQYIRHPSGQSGRDAKVLGVRTMLKF
jgi:porin